MIRIFVLLSCFYVFSQSATTGKKINVPDSDSTLQDLIVKTVTPEANRQIHDSNWWIATPNQHHATKVSVLNNGKLYSTYSFETTFQRSACPQKTPLSQVSKCQSDSSKSQKVLCRTTLAWNEKDYSSIEQETYCNRK
ncbi:unnamed protein product [Auanema sp. JU1783]|nr:unnamed protein product [Auanema sp. JU1783]